MNSAQGESETAREDVMTIRARVELQTNEGESVQTIDLAVAPEAWTVADAQGCVRRLQAVTGSPAYPLEQLVRVACTTPRTRSWSGWR
jgi:hypothetical protein